MATKSPVETVGVDPNAQHPLAMPYEEALQKQLDKFLFGRGSPVAQKIRNLLNGTWLGEPLHVILTDIPVGAWTVTLVFDAMELIVGRRKFAMAADTSLAIGLAGAASAAVAGLVDWSDVDPPARRIGMIHGLLNATSTVLFATSLIFRNKGARTGGRVVAALGYGAMTVAAHLGGKMVYQHRVGVDRTAGQVFPEEFQAVMRDAQLMESKPTRAEHNGVPILLVRKGKRIFAMAETCSHFSAPLSEGKLIDDSIVCPNHDSRFALEDGRVINGPAVHPQPCLEARVKDGQIEVRRRSVKG